jgi:hypothetical protein
MKNLLLFILLILAAGCSKHKDPGFTSAEGKWTYATPDAKIAVTFDLVKNSSGGLDIQNQTIKIDGTLYQSVSQITGVILPSIQKIRINANDAKIVYPYNIEFNTGTVSGDFKTITFSTATYTWPYPTVLNLTTVKVTRG